jgi:hypothetical protein
MLHRNGKQIYGCQHDRGLINQHCTQCGKFVDFRKFKKVKKVVDEWDDPIIEEAERFIFEEELKQKEEVDSK